MRTKEFLEKHKAAIQFLAIDFRSKKTTCVGTDEFLRTISNNDLEVLGFVCNILIEDLDHILEHLVKEMDLRKAAGYKYIMPEDVDTLTEITCNG